MLSENEIGLLAEKCKALPKPHQVCLDDNYIIGLFNTVLDFQMHGEAVDNALKYYRANRQHEIHAPSDLESLFSRFPDDKEGNTGLAGYLWGNRHWTRASLLRQLVTLFSSQGICSIEALRSWARTSSYERDFQGRIRGMGFAIYKWLVMRQGVETVKPDVMIRRFVESTTGRAGVSDEALVDAVERAAKQLGKKANQLDAAIWEYQRKQIAKPRGPRICLGTLPSANGGEDNAKMMLK